MKNEQTLAYILLVRLTPNEANYLWYLDVQNLFQNI